jgi:hypothetical protein
MTPPGQLGQALSGSVTYGAGVGALYQLKAPVGTPVQLVWQVAGGAHVDVT